MSQSKSKKCSICHKVKLLSQFYSFIRKRDGKEYFRKECKRCSNKIRTESYRRDKKKPRQYVSPYRNDIEDMPNHAPRRYQIMNMYANGWKLSEISEALGIKKFSINEILCSGYIRYGVRTRYELIARAAVAGIVKFDDGKTS